MKEYGDGDLCVCCMFLLVNGDRCEECDHSDHPLMELLKGEDVTPNWDNDDEPGFKWSWCDGCGVIQGGNYYRIAIWEKD